MGRPHYRLIRKFRFSEAERVLRGGAALQDACAELLPPGGDVLVAPLVGALLQRLAAHDDGEPLVLVRAAGGALQVALRHDPGLLPHPGRRHHAPGEEADQADPEEERCHAELAGYLSRWRERARATLGSFPD